MQKINTFFVYRMTYKSDFVKILFENLENYSQPPF